MTISRFILASPSYLHDTSFVAAFSYFISPGEA